MAYDHDLADRIRALLAEEPVREKAMFGGLAFLIGGNMSVTANRQGGLLVRFDPAETEELLAEPGAEEFEMGRGGPKKGWLRVHPEVLADDEVLATWVTRSVDYARTLPAK